MSDDVEEGAGVEEAQDEPQLLLVHEGGEVGDHVLVVAAGHGLDLLEQLVHAGVPLFQVNALYGALLVANLAVGGVNHRGSPVPYNLLHLVTKKNRKKGK